jgi:hypothetical protein
MAPGNFMANTPLEFLVSGSEIGLETLYLMPGEPLPQSLPPHDVLFGHRRIGLRRTCWPSWAAPWTAGIRRCSTTPCTRCAWPATRSR